MSNLKSYLESRISRATNTIEEFKFDMTNSPKRAVISGNTDMVAAALQLSVLMELLTGVYKVESGEVELEHFRKRVMRTIFNQSQFVKPMDSSINNAETIVKLTTYSEFYEECFND